MTYAEMAVRFPEMKTILAAKIKKKKRIDNENWTQHGSYTKVWYIEHTEEVAGVKEFYKSTREVTEYSSVSSVSECNANSQSYYYDTSSRRLYVHTKNSDDPGGGSYYLMSLVWHRVATKEIEISGYKYRAHLRTEGLPSVSAEIEAFRRGSLQQSISSISFHNENKFYDTEMINYIYETAEIEIIAVGSARGITSDPLTIWTGWTGGIEWTDMVVTIDVFDLRRIVP